MFCTMAPFLSTNWSSTPTTQSAGEAVIENRWMDGLQTEKQEKKPSKTTIILTISVHNISHSRTVESTSLKYLLFLSTDTR